MILNKTFEFVFYHDYKCLDKIDFMNWLQSVIWVQR